MSSRPEKLTGATESFEAEAEAEIVNISFVTIFMTAVWKTGRQDGRENVAAGPELSSHLNRFDTFNTNIIWLHGGHWAFIVLLLQNNS